MKIKRTFESFIQFLKNIYKSKKKNGAFLSTQNYLAYVKAVIADLGLPADLFHSVSIDQLIKWKSELMLRRTFLSRPSKHQGDILCGYNSYIEFVRYQQNLQPLALSQTL